MHQQALVRCGDGDLAGFVAKIIHPVHAIVFCRRHPERMRLDLLIGKGPRRHVQVLLRQRDRAPVGYLGFVNDMVAGAHGSAQGQRIHAVCVLVGWQQV